MKTLLLCLLLFMGGCYSTPPPREPPPPPRLDIPYFQCKTIEERSVYDASLRDDQERVEAMAAFHRTMPIRFGVEVIPTKAVESMRYPPLAGEVILLRLRLEARGAYVDQMDGLEAQPYLVHDGTIYQSIVASSQERLLPSGNHDLARALFAEKEPTPLDAEAARRAKDWQSNRGPRVNGSEGKSYDATCKSQANKGACEALIPFARVGPAWGKELIGIKLKLMIQDKHGWCLVNDTRTLVLPEGANLESRVNDAFRGGGVDL